VKTLAAAISRIEYAEPSLLTLTPWRVSGLL
jgi:hypothetical protein